MLLLFFFFQAEDGIRDKLVTGVQTCALPILSSIAAEDILHDLGALSMMSSDSQAMGRLGEVIIRNWQTAYKMKKKRGSLVEEKGNNDNFRDKRYIAKYTIKPAISHDVSKSIRSATKR